MLQRPRPGWGRPRRDAWRRPLRRRCPGFLFVIHLSRRLRPGREHCCLKRNRWLVQGWQNRPQTYVFSCELLFHVCGGMIHVAGAPSAGQADRSLPKPVMVARTVGACGPGRLWYRSPVLFLELSGNRAGCLPKFNRGSGRPWMVPSCGCGGKFPAAYLAPRA